MARLKQLNHWKFEVKYRYLIQVCMARAGRYITNIKYSFDVYLNPSKKLKLASLSERIDFYRHLKL